MKALLWQLSTCGSVPKGNEVLEAMNRIVNHGVRVCDLLSKL